MIDFAELVAHARGRWRDILQAHGVAARFLHNKHGPCPICGGKDRYRFDDKNGSGSYYCNQCGPGNGLTLLRKLHGWDLHTAGAKVAEFLGRATTRRATPTPTPTTSSAERRRHDVEAVLQRATSPAIVADYLAARGLSVVPAVLRGHPALAYFDDGKRAGTFPAVVAPVLGPDGKLQSAHRIYVTDQVPKRERKKLMPAVETVRGGAARLFDAGYTLGVAEGVETAIAVYEMFNVPVWAAITAGGVESFEPPPGVRYLKIFGDNDASFTGQKAAYALAHRLYPKLEQVEVFIPEKADTDWLDVLNEERGP